MNKKALNLSLRFSLELGAVGAVGLWGYLQNETWTRWLLAFGLPILFMAIWGIFAVPNDSSRSGKAPVPTNGILRLLIELGLFAIATWTMYDGGYDFYNFFGITVIIHYTLAYKRIRWLLNQ